MKKITLLVSVLALLSASCNPFSTSAPVTVGIVKTANGGVDWQSANVIKDNGEQSLNRSISKIKLSPDGNTVLASAYDGGLYKTTDAAESWEEVLGQIPLYDFAFNPNDDQMIYAAGYLEKRGRVFKTVDGGKSWTDIYADAGDSNPVRALAINPLSSNQLVAGLGKGSLILSEDSGLSWRLLENYNGRINQVIWQDSAMFVVVKERGVFKSTNGGQDFEQINKNIKPAVSSLGASIFGSGLSDYRQIAVSLDGQSIYLTTNHGLYKSLDGGGSWEYVSMPYRQQDAAPHAVATPAFSSSPIYVSSGSVIFKSNDGGYAWSIGDTKTNGLVTTILLDPDLDTLTFAGVSK